MAEKTLYIFNPEHDLALASGEVNYMAPASARRMATELALLPVWYAEEGSAVLAASAYNLDYLRKMQEMFSLSVTLLTEPELAEETQFEETKSEETQSDVAPEQTEEPLWDIRPWGWDVAVRQRLKVLGVSESNLPDKAQLQALRSASHRLSAVELLPRLQLGSHFCGESFYLTLPEDWQHFVESQEVCLLKAPLSGSGKGLNWCKGVFTPSISGWCARIGSQQGGVVGEPIYNKVEDFAMEFLSSGDGRVVFAGYSQFRTGGSGAYEGNLLASDALIEQNLSAYVPLEELHRLRSTLERELSLRFGTLHKGYLGVDMMISRFPEAPVYRIHPCVEINLRMNMGVVARLFHDRYVHPDSSGSFQISYCPTEGDAWRQHEQMAAANPLQIESGKIISGYMPLVPVNKRSCYRAWIFVAANHS